MGAERFESFDHGLVLKLAAGAEHYLALARQYGREEFREYNGKLRQRDLLIVDADSACIPASCQ